MNFPIYLQYKLKTNDRGKQVPLDEFPLESFWEHPLLSQLQIPISWRLSQKFAL